MGAYAGQYGNLAQLDSAADAQDPAYDISAAIVTSPKQIAYETQRVQPPSNLYVGLNDYVLVQWYSPEISVQFEVCGRLLEPDGSVKIFDETIQTQIGDSGQQYQIRLTEGFLLNVSLVSRITQFQRGKVFVIVTLQRGSLGSPTFLQSLIQDYVWTGSITQWPGSILHSPTEGQGSIEVINVPTSLGSDWSLNTHTLVRMRLLSVRATLVTDSVVITRQPQFIMQDGGLNVYWSCDPPAGQTASQVVSYNLFPATSRAAALVHAALIPIPDPAILGPAHSLASTTAGLDPNDSWATVFAQVEKLVQL